MYFVAKKHYKVFLAAIFIVINNNIYILYIYYNNYKLNKMDELRV